MKASKLIFSLLLTVLGTFVAITPVTATTDNKTDLVAWDQYSLSVRGERLFIFSGEFQYQRLPVPEMWLDVFQKLRANGFNAVSSTLSSITSSFPMMAVSAKRDGRNVSLIVLLIFVENSVLLLELSFTDQRYLRLHQWRS